LILGGTLVVAVAAAAQGRLDPGFGNGGVVVTATGPAAGADFPERPRNPTRRPDPRRRLFRHGAAGGHQWRISRYTHTGELDSSFGTGGTVTTSMSSADGIDEHVWTLTLDRDGKIVAAGDAVTTTGGFDVALARFNPDEAWRRSSTTSA